MATKYNFTEGYNKDVKDEIPKWMDNLFTDGIQKQQPVIINDLYNANKPKVKKCSSCGKLLLPNEIGKCLACSNINK